MPSSSHHSPEDSGLEYSRPERAGNESHRVRARSSRPEKYTLSSAPRRVSSAVSASSAEESDARRAKARRRLRWKRRLTMWEWIGFGASCIACAFLLRAVVAAQSDFFQVRGQVHEKQIQLAALDRQTSDEKNRLAHLQSEKGREQLLAERGYLKPGDRILLFPNEQPKADTH